MALPHPPSLALVLREGLINSDARLVPRPPNPISLSRKFISSSRTGSHQFRMFPLQFSFSRCGKISRSNFPNFDDRFNSTPLIRFRIFNSTKIQANFDDFEISFFYSVLSRRRRITGLYARPRITIWCLLLLLLLLAVSLRYPGVPYYIGNVRAESRSPVGGCAGDVGDGGQRRRGRKEMAPGGVIEAT